MDVRKEQVPRDLQLATGEKFIEREKMIYARNKELSNSLHQMRENCVKEIHHLLGSKAEEYVAFREKSRNRSGDMHSLYIPTPEGEKIRSEVRKRSLADAREFIQSLEVDITKVKQVQKKYLSQSQSAFEKAMNVTEASYGGVNSTGPPKQMIDPWTWKSPPYDYSRGYANYSSSTGTNGALHYENHLTGEINCESWLKLANTDDSDYCYAQSMSEISFWFQMPATGLIEVWVDLQCIDTQYSGCLEDEWGWSEASIQQQSRAYLGVLDGGGLRYAKLLDIQRESNEGCWAGTVAQPGDELWPHFYSMEPFEVGQWVLIRIGVMDDNDCWVNDMSCDGSMRNSWFVRTIALKSTGGP
jgi:hypothetical protein